MAHVPAQLRQWDEHLARVADGRPNPASRNADVETLATKADLTALEARIYRAMLVQAGAIVGALVGIAGIVVGARRLLG